MNLSADDIVRIHASFGPAGELIEQRRAVYLAAIELLAGRSAAAECGLDVLDSPLTRAHLGEVMGGTISFSADRLRSMDDLVDRAAHARVHGMRVAASSRAESRLEPALRRIGRELGRPSMNAGLRVLTSADPGFDAARTRLVAGVELLVELVPVLARDLIGHVALVAMLQRDGAEALGSASAREFPGLVMIPEPGGDLEVAEAIVHEGAHQKFFDLAVTRDLLVVPRSRPPLFRPSWATAAPRWPVEQAVAALHAYVCLNALFVECSKRDDLSLHSFSLLPAAADRARELGAWLDEHSESLGIDGRRFVALLSSSLLAPAIVAPAPQPGLPDVPEDGEDVLVRRCGTRTLVARRAQPIEMFWICAGQE